jgi:hypothetical protein
MKVSALRKLLDLLGNEDAEVYIDNLEVEYFDAWQSSVNELSFGQRKYVHPKYLKVAARPCQETNGSREALVLYVKSKEE